MRWWKVIGYSIGWGCVQTVVSVDCSVTPMYQLLHLTRCGDEGVGSDPKLWIHYQWCQSFAPCDSRWPLFVRWLFLMTIKRLCAIQDWSDCSDTTDHREIFRDCQSGHFRADASVEGLDERERRMWNSREQRKSKDGFLHLMMNFLRRRRWEMRREIRSYIFRCWWRRIIYKDLLKKWSSRGE